MRPTLLDLAKLTGLDPVIGIVESLQQSNGLLKTMRWRGIKGASTRYGKRVGLPNVSFRGLNQGVARGKSRTINYTINTKILEGRSVADYVEAGRFPGGYKAYRAQEDSAYLSSFSNTFNLNAFYGDETANVNTFNGFATLYNSLSFNTVLSAGGSTADLQTSIYLVSWDDVGKRRAPEGLLADGKIIEQLDLGLILETDADGLQFPAYCTDYIWEPTLAIYEERSIGRICNIDATNKVTPELLDTMINQMLPFKPSYILAPRIALGQIQGIKTGAVQYLNSDTNLNERVTHYAGIPIIWDENISVTEAVVA